MAIKTVTVKSLNPIRCDGYAEMAPGDLALLQLDQAALPNLPPTINGTVQTPVDRVAMVPEPGACAIMGYAYIIAYESDDLNGALLELRPNDILSVGCRTCCEVVAERLDLFDSQNTPLIRSAPPENGTAGEYQYILLNRPTFVTTDPGIAKMTVNDPRTGPFDILMTFSAGMTGADQVAAVKQALDNSTGFRSIASVSDTANGIILQRDIMAAYTPGFSIVFDAGGTGSVLNFQGIVSGLSPNAGTPGLLGQRAFVNVTLPNIGAVVDIWTCINSTPPRWAPPSGFLIDLQNGNALKRPYIDSDGAFTWAPAY